MNRHTGTTSSRRFKSSLHSLRHALGLSTLLLPVLIACSSSPGAASTPMSAGPGDMQVDLIVHPFCVEATCNSECAAEPGVAGGACVLGQCRCDAVKCARGDLNCDGMADIVLVGGDNWSTIPVAFSTGNGNFGTVTNSGVGSIPALASTPGARRALTPSSDPRVLVPGASGSTTVPYALSASNGSFTFFDAPPPCSTLSPSFPALASAPGAQLVTGDFSGGGGDEYALVGGAGWSSIPVIFTLGCSDRPITDFATWASTAGAQIVTGDFDGDGKTDIALEGGAGWGSLPVAYSNGDGTFTVTNTAIGGSGGATFAEWAQEPVAKMVAGDFNKDGKDDLALTGGPGWSSIPVAFATATRGTFNVTNGSVGTPDMPFGQWASTPGAQVVAGDFDGHGYAGIALVGGPGWGSVPVAHSNGDGSFSVTNAAVGSFAAWAAQRNVSALSASNATQVSCASGFVQSAGYCVYPSGTVSSNGSCVSCGALGQPICDNGSACTQANTVASSGQCVCGNDTDDSNGICCPSDTVNTNGACAPCPFGTVWLRNACLPSSHTWTFPETDGTYFGVHPQTLTVNWDGSWSWQGQFWMNSGPAYFLRERPRHHRPDDERWARLLPPAHRHPVGLRQFQRPGQRQLERLRQRHVQPRLGQLGGDRERQRDDQGRAQYDSGGNLGGSRDPSRRRGLDRLGGGLAWISRARDESSRGRSGGTAFARMSRSPRSSPRFDENGPVRPKSPPPPPESNVLRHVDVTIQAAAHRWSGIPVQSRPGSSCTTALPRAEHIVEAKRVPRPPEMQSYSFQCPQPRAM